MAYQLTDMQALLSDAARNAKSSLGYSYQQKDWAFIQAARRWRRLTLATRQVSTLALTPGSNALPALPTNFLPEFELNTYLTLSGQTLDPGLRLVPYTEVLQAQAESWGFPTNVGTSPAQGRPYLMGFQTRTAGFVYPTPDQAYTVNIEWWNDVTVWKPGQAFISANVSGGVITSFTYTIPGSIYTSAPTITITDPTGTGFVAGAVTLVKGGITAIAISAAGTGYTSPTVLINGVSAVLPVFTLPDEHLEPIASLGAVYFLQKGEPQNRPAANDALADFEKEAERFKARGTGGLGERVIHRTPPDWAQQGCGRAR